MKLKLNNIRDKSQNIININNINNINNRNYIYNNSINNLYKINIPRNTSNNNRKINHKIHRNKKVTSLIKKSDSKNNIYSSQITKRYYIANHSHKNISLPNANHIYNNKQRDIQIYKPKNQNKNQFIIKQKKYINIFDSPKKENEEKIKFLMPKLMKRHFDITKSVEVEKEKIEEVKDLFNKIIDDFEQ